MKKIMMAFVACLLGLVACKKDSNQDSKDSNIVGKWQWIVQYYDNPDSSTPQSTGIHETLAIYSNSTYSRTQNAAVTDTGHYKLGTGRDPFNGQAVKEIYFTNNNSVTDTGYYCYAGADTLIFDSGLIGIVGSGSRYYVK